MINPSSLFVDTSGWACLFVPTEAHHEQAKEQYALAVGTAKRSSGITVYTTNYVLSELVALLTRDVTRPRLLGYIKLIQSASYVKILHIDESLDRRAWGELDKRHDKQWSLVDASSFVIMSQIGLQQALTTDRHFEQAGFVRLLK